MEQNREREKQKAGAERFILLIYTFYALSISHNMLHSRGESWIAVIIMLGVVLSWVVCLLRYQSYNVRATVVTVCISVALFFAGYQNDDLYEMIPAMVVLTCLIGLYGIPELMPVAAINLLIQLIKQASVVLSGDYKGLEDFYPLIFLSVHVFFFVLILAVWVKNRARSAQRMAEILEEQKKAERGKDDFMANVSHEIRTPLNSIYGISELLKTETDPEAVTRDIQDIQVASRKLMSLVSDILDFSELSTGKVEVEEEIYDVTSTINDIINMTMAQISEKELELIVRLDTKMPRLLMGDEKKIRRIIMNLVNNAVKFTNSGCIVLSVQGRRESYGLNLSFAVSDTGIGMKEEEIEKLFTNYNQADSRRNRQGSGIGLGMAISGLLAKKIGGVITVRSKEGKGSTFSFVVPQRIVADSPIVQLRKDFSPAVAYYFNVEQFRMKEIRDAYTGMIDNMIEQFGIPCQSCINLDQLKRKVARKKFDYVFISYAEYREDPEYFQSLSEQLRLVVVLDSRSDNKDIVGNVIRVEKPFSVLSVASVLLSDVRKDVKLPNPHTTKFKAPTAKVLVVDDNKVNIMVAEGLLSHYEIKVDKAFSGAEALEKIDCMDYDFVFMDHMMPEMDGVETLHRIRAKYGSYFQKVPVVALTANAIAGSREMFMSEGFSDFLEKPIGPSVLERVLRRNLPAEKLVDLTEEDIDKPEDETPMNVEENEMQKTDDDNLWDIMDKERGLLYCGGENGYRVVLAEIVRLYHETAADLEKVFAEHDYENYTIKIHALKSSMNSIGATRLGEKAKTLEFAGKSGDYALIESGHSEVMQEYHDLLKKISEEPYVRELLGADYEFDSANIEETEMACKLREISGEDFAVLQKSFESAMYNLDEVSMQEIVATLKECSVCGVDLQRVIGKIEHKISCGDYFSAGELLLSVTIPEKEDS